MLPSTHNATRLTPSHSLQHGHGQSGIPSVVAAAAHGAFPTSDSYLSQLVMSQHNANGGKRLSPAEAAAMNAMRGAQAAAAAVSDELTAPRVVPSMQSMMNVGSSALQHAAYAQQLHVQAQAQAQALARAQAQD